jgi:hypothetical protein
MPKEGIQIKIAAVNKSVSSVIVSIPAAETVPTRGYFQVHAEHPGRF